MMPSPPRRRAEPPHVRTAGGSNTRRSRCNALAKDATKCGDLRLAAATRLAARSGSAAAHVVAWALAGRLTVKD
jgi:hypothetical protein